MSIVHINDQYEWIRNPGTILIPQYFITLYYFKQQQPGKHLFRAGLQMNHGVTLRAVIHGHQPISQPVQLPHKRVLEGGQRKGIEVGLNLLAPQCLLANLAACYDQIRDWASSVPLGKKLLACRDNELQNCFWIWIVNKVKGQRLICCSHCICTGIGAESCLPLISGE